MTNEEAKQIVDAAIAKGIVSKPKALVKTELGDNFKLSASNPIEMVQCHQVELRGIPVIPLVVFKRPKRIKLSFYDPFDYELLSSSDLCYNPRLCANGIYTRYARRMAACLKSVMTYALEGRTPKMRVEISH